VVVIGSGVIKAGSIFQPMPLEGIRNIANYYKDDGPSTAKKGGQQRLIKWKKKSIRFLLHDGHRVLGLRLDFSLTPALVEPWLQRTT